MNTASMSAVTEMKIGCTTFVVESVISDSAKETAYEKIKKMIVKEAKAQIRQKAL